MDRSAKNQHELTPDEKEIKHLKHRYHELLLDKNSFLHDMHSPVAKTSPEIMKKYQEEITKIDVWIENVKDKLIEKGLQLHRGQWF